MFKIRILAFAAAMLVAAGCTQVTDKSGAKDYDIVGKIIAITADKVTLDHQAIPGLMNAMEMPFRIADEGVVKGFQVGDAVKGKLRVKDGTSTILSLEKMSGAAIPVTDKAAKIKAALAKLDPKDRVLAEAQKTCPITGGPLGAMGPPEKLMIKGEPVFVCCDGCNESAIEDADKTLAKVHEYQAKNKTPAK